VELKLNLDVPRFSVLLINTSRTCFKTAPESSNKFKKLARTGFLSKLAKNWTIFAQPMKGKESVNKI